MPFVIHLNQTLYIDRSPTETRYLPGALHALCSWTWLDLLCGETLADSLCSTTVGNLPHLPPVCAISLLPTFLVLDNYSPHLDGT